MRCAATEETVAPALLDADLSSIWSFGVYRETNICLNTHEDTAAVLRICPHPHDRERASHVSLGA